MKTKLHPTPDDGQIDRLLARRYRDTTPEFEARWVALKRDLRQRPSRRARFAFPWRFAGWFGVVGASAALALVLHFNRPSTVAPDGLEPSPQLAELFAMDAVLGQAVPLLDEENRTALLNLPANSQPKLNPP
jgi:hypothetical protein